jgi:glutathione S-transferase
MLTFYYHPLSPVARRVWIALLEKDIPVESEIVNLKGEQFRPEFLAVNPFHHVPVIVDDGLRVLESLAILDYLEAKYPNPSLMPQTPEAIAQMRMVQMVTANELTPKLPALTIASESSEPDVETLQQVHTIFGFLAEQLGTGDYFGGDRLSLADVTLGAAMPLLHRLGVSFEAHPTLATWFERIVVRESWQTTEPDDAAFNTWKRWMLVMIKRRQQQMARAKSA